MSIPALNNIYTTLRQNFLCLRVGEEWHEKSKTVSLDYWIHSALPCGKYLILRIPIETLELAGNKEETLRFMSICSSKGECTSPPFFHPFGFLYWCTSATCASFFLNGNKSLFVGLNVVLIRYMEHTFVNKRLVAFRERGSLAFIGVFKRLNCVHFQQLSHHYKFTLVILES